MKKSILELRNDLLHLGKDINSNLYSFETKEKINEPFFTFDESTNIVTMLLEVQGTQYEGRNARIENLFVNDIVKVEREPNNEHNKFNLSVRNLKNESLGNVSSDICDVISPLIDNKSLVIDGAQVIYVEPLSKRSARCKKSLLTVKVIMHFKDFMIDKNNCSIICILGGDQTRIWAQELSVIKCFIPLQEAMLLFEVYNRANDEYNNEGLNYFGLDNLADEVIYAREQMKKNKMKDYSYETIYKTDNFLDYMKRIIDQESERYGILKKYILPIDEEDMYDNYYSFKDLIYSNAIDEKKYYWVDQCRVDKNEFEYQTGYEFNHWYEIAELYDPNEKLPFDLTDEDIVSIFGFNKFKAFSDLSYGC